MVRRDNADECLWAIDECSCQSQDEEQYHRACATLLQCDEAEYRYQGTDHTDETGACRATLEQLVACPTCYEHTYNTEYLEYEDSDACPLCAHTAVLTQEGRSPVEHRKADDIDEEVGYSQCPDDRVLPHVLADEGRDLGCGLGALLALLVALLKFRQAYALWCVAQDSCGDEDTDSSDDTWDDEHHLPRAIVLRCRYHCAVGDILAEVGCDGGDNIGIARHIATHHTHNEYAEDASQACTNRVGGVPNRHLGGQLRCRYPTRNQSAARRESATLEELIEDVEYRYE